MSFYKEIAIQAALEAGEILRSDFFIQSRVDGKGLHDIVTQSDRQSEAAIVKILRRHFPEFSYVAEESGKHQTESEYTWYIDPLDGTLNFVSGNPYFSVSIALAFKGEIIMGVVYNPIVNELYTAEKGHGAFLNNSQIHVNAKADLKEVLIAASFSADASRVKEELQTIEKLSINSRRVLINFSPALDLCNIARGRIEGLVDKGTTPEDHSAGSLILTEAGGKIENFNNQEWNIEATGLIASNGYLQNVISDLVR